MWLRPSQISATLPAVGITRTFAAPRSIRKDGPLEEFDFQEFTGRSTPAVHEPMATVQRSGKSISLNHAAFEALGRAEHVVLLFDVKRRAIGIKPASADVPHSYAVKRQNHSDSYLVSSSAFTSHHRIDTSVSRRYRCTVLGNVLVIDVDNPLMVLANRRGPRPANAAAEA